MKIEAGRYVHEVDDGQWHLDRPHVEPQILALIQYGMRHARISAMDTHSAEFVGTEGAPEIRFVGTYGEKVVRV